MKLKNKFALVTGASTGIGRAMAIKTIKNYIQALLEIPEVIGHHWFLKNVCQLRFRQN